MAATDMSKAQYEPGCKVIIRPAGEREGSFSAEEATRLDCQHVAGPLTYVSTDFSYLVLERDGIRYREHYSDCERDYDDAQAARQQRFDRLLAVFPGDAGVPEENDTIERFVCVQKNEDPKGDGSFAFQWGDTFKDAVSLVGGEIFDGWYPRGVFDLDTGEKIDVSVSSPVISKAEDQGVTINELDAGQVAESQQYIKHNYDHVADVFTVSITVPPDRGDEIAALLDTICKADWIEQANVRREAIRQVSTEALERFRERATEAEERS